MIKELDGVILEELANIFELRVLNHASEDSEEAWDFHQVFLILKKAAPKSALAFSGLFQSYLFYLSCTQLFY